MIERTFDCARADWIINHPDVRPFVAFDTSIYPMSLEDIVQDTRHHLLMGDKGGFLFVQQEPEVYHLHTFFLPEGRGRYALLASHRAAEYMFFGTDCTEILTVSPDDVPHSKPPKHMGFVFEFHRDNIAVRNGLSIGGSYYAMRYPEWVKRAPGLEKSGQWFHAKLEDAATHDDEDVHDRYVGAACRMMAAGQVHKGVFHYNRWACFAGYAPLFIESESPFVLKMGEQRLKLSDDLQDFEVMKCQ